MRIASLFSFVLLVAACGSSSNDIDDISTWDDRDAGAEPDAARPQPMPLADGTGAAVLTEFEGAVFEATFDYNVSLVASAEDRLFVAGTSPGTDLEGDLLGNGHGMLAELDKTGRVIWETPLSAEWLTLRTFAASNEGLWLGFDAGGEVVVGAETVGSLPTGLFDYEHFLVFVEFDGQPRWTKQLGVESAVRDPRGGVWITTPDGCSTLARLDADGNDVWRRCGFNDREVTGSFSVDAIEVDQMGGAFSSRIEPLERDGPTVDLGDGPVEIDCANHRTSALAWVDAAGGTERHTTMCNGSFSHLSAVSDGMLTAGSLTRLEERQGTIRIADAEFANETFERLESHATLLARDGQHIYSRAFGGDLSLLASAENGDVLFFADYANAESPLAQGLEVDEGGVLGVLVAGEEARVRWVRPGAGVSSAAAVESGGWLVGIPRSRPTDPIRVLLLPQ